jgi:phage terminase large subunit-like protein
VDESDDWTAESTWRKANPNWGVSVMPEVVAQLCAKAMELPAAQANFQTKHLNIWVNADSAWMNMQKFRACADPDLSLDDFGGCRCWIGLDLASKTDIAARYLLFERELDGQKHYYGFLRSFLPESAVQESRNSQYSGWEIEGRITTTPGFVLDFGVIEGDLIDCFSRFDVQEVAYDPWQATQLASRMTEAGAIMVEYRNTVQNFSQPMKEFDALVQSGRFHYDGDPVFEWMVSNVVCHVDAKENIYPRKETSANKIDGVVAAIMAIGRAISVPEVPAYTGDLLVV